MKTRSGQGPLARAGQTAFGQNLLPRMAQLLLGVWLICSAFLWPHLRVQALVVWATGGLAILLSIASLWVQPFRLLLGLVAVWLFIGTFTEPALVATLVNNLFCAVALFALSFLPRGNVRLFRRQNRHRTA